MRALQRCSRRVSALSRNRMFVPMELFARPQKRSGDREDDPWRTDGVEVVGCAGETVRVARVDAMEDGA